MVYNFVLYFLTHLAIWSVNCVLFKNFATRVAIKIWPQVKVRTFDSRQQSKYSLNDQFTDADVDASVDEDAFFSKKSLALEFTFISVQVQIVVHLDRFILSSKLEC